MMKGLSLKNACEYDRFEEGAFLNPPSVLGPTYAWVWNDRLSYEGIDKQLSEIADLGAKAVYALAEPASFRPKLMDTRLEPEYLSDEYFQYLLYAAKRAKALGLDFWFYDEGGWPSGGVCGRVVENKPELARAGIEKGEVRLEGGERVSDDGLLALFSLDGKRLPVDYSPTSAETVVAFARHPTSVRVPGSWSPLYPNVLEPEAVAEFIRLTHERLRAATDDHPGEYVSCSFTDEPSTGAYPWARDAQSDFSSKYGYDILDFLPAIFDESREDAASQKARMDYCDWSTRRFAEVYLGGLRNWCAAHDILSVGHLGGEDETIRAGKLGVMRALRAFDIPGVDAIWRQIFPTNDVNHHFPRYAASAAHQGGTRWAFTETGGVYGSGFTAAQNRWTTLYQMVRGINIINQMLVSYGRDDFLMTGEKPLYFPEMPGFSYHAEYNKYVSRMSYLMSLGEPDVHCAVYLPTRDLCAGGRHADDAARRYDQAVSTLEHMSAQFDIFDDEVLESGTVACESLCFQSVKYRTLIVPACSYIDRDKLARCAKGGVSILWVGDGAPEGAETIDDSELLSRDELRALRANCPSLRAAKRKAANGAIYLVFNESTEYARAELEFDETAPARLIDVERALVCACDAKTEGERTQVSALFAPGEAKVFFFGALAASDFPPYRKLGRVGTIDGFDLRPEREFRIGEREYESIVRRDAPRAVSLGDWRGVLGEDYSGTATYEASFDSDGEAAWLDLGEVRHMCEAELNGKRLGVRFAPPYAFDVRGLLKPRANSLKITVANTAANQFSHTRAFERFESSKLGPYHEKTIPFELDSSDGGLYGPVTLYRE